MKMTEEDLLKAIGMADEDTIENSAPPEWNLNTQIQGTWAPQFHFRRTATMLAVGAMFFIFICLVCLLARLNYANMRTKYDTPEERAAYSVLKDYMNAAVKGDQSKMLELSLTDKVTGMMYEKKEAEQYKQEILDGYSLVEDFKIGHVQDITVEYRNEEQNERERLELGYYGFMEQNRTVKAMQYLKENNSALKFYVRVNQAYSFKVQLTLPDSGRKDDADTYTEIDVVNYMGQWLVQPVEYIAPDEVSAEDKEKLESLKIKYGTIDIPVAD